MAEEACTLETLYFTAINVLCIDFSKIVDYFKPLPFSLLFPKTQLKKKNISIIDFLHLFSFT